MAGLFVHDLVSRSYLLRVRPNLIHGDFTEASKCGSEWHHRPARHKARALRIPEGRLRFRCGAWRFLAGDSTIEWAAYG